jgi:Chaperone of endosialidase
VNALYSNTTGTYNTATGQNALYSNTTGTRNTANGDYALLTNTTGGSNTAIGVGAMFSNTTGGSNTANGVDALYSNTTGGSNTANGDFALYSNAAGFDNTATGQYALYFNTGSTNTAYGWEALAFNTTGTNNIGLGYAAGFHLTTGSNNIDIGNFAVAAEANTIRIGTAGTQTATYIAGISGATASGGAAVFVNSNGQLGTATSSRRFKQEIKPMDKASEAILALRPVTFRYKRDIDPKGIPQFGLVAEEVAQVNPDLVVRDSEGKVYTVRYEAVNAMLLNEFLKQNRTVQELKSTVAKQEATVAQQQKDFQSTIAQQQKEIKTLTASLKEQASQIQKVSAQLEVSSPRQAARLVDGNQ